jgi:cyclopropane fatty-acyl-phospholipid synthase-like methyltransferase
MSHFDRGDRAQEYIRMSEGYDGSELIKVLKKHLPSGSSVLELGMGPGKDLDILRESYRVTGSDNSHKFLDIYREKNKHVDLLFLDAVTLHTDRRFDCIYSNKVLIHLSGEQLKLSFDRQRKILHPGGLLLHSFWYGESEEFFNGLRFNYLTEDVLLKIVEPSYEVLEIKSSLDKK